MASQGSIQQEIKDGAYESFDPELRRAFEFTDASVPDSIKTKAAFKMSKDKVKLSGDGTFYTLQGEGPTMGLPCVFCRLHVCNLRCSWCDAWYTWNPNTNEFWTEPNDVSFAECADRIRQTWDERNGRSKKRVIWTGGEPLIQRKQIEEVSRELGYEWANEVETNGTLMPTEYELQVFQFNCSPKLTNSENKHHSMVKPKVLASLNEANTTFKFVCETDKDLDEIEEKYLPHIDHEKVIIMPQGIVAEEIDKHMKQLAEPCKQRGYRLLGRMQAQAWDGARRGV